MGQAVIEEARREMDRKQLRERRGRCRNHRGALGSREEGLGLGNELRRVRGPILVTGTCF